MIYKNSTIPSNFNKIAEISDNYIVYVKESTLHNGINYEAYIQYINPSTYVLYINDYKIRNGDYYSYDINYLNNGLYNYIDSIDCNYTLSTYTVDSNLISYENSNRGDIVMIFLGQILCCICVLWVFKQLSRLFFRGGLW